MDFIDNFKKFGEKENRVYLILVIWLLIGYAAMAIFNLVDIPIVGILIYFPLLGFTLFLCFISLLGKEIKEYSIPKLIFLLAIDIVLMILLLLVVIVFLIVSVFFYIFITSYFILYGCYKAGRERDEKLYYKKGAWFWRRLEFHGGLIFSLVLLFIFLIVTWEVAILTDVTVLIVIAYIAVIIVLIGLTIYCYIESIGKRRLNAWLGTYFVFVTIYTFYLVLKVFMGLYGGTGDGTTSIYLIIALLFLDLFVLLYSISSIIGTKGEILHEKLKFFKFDTCLLWLIFSKAAWEFAINYPYGLFGGPQALGITDVSEIGSLIRLIANIFILAIFFVLIIVFGIYGIRKYPELKEKMKAEKLKESEDQILENEG